MQAVILAAGKSKRFYPFTALPHKSFISLMGKPLLVQTLHSLKKAKVTDVVIVVSENSPIPSLIPPVDGLSIRFVVQVDTLGMGHALLAAKEYLEESFFLLSAYHFECDKIIPQLLKTKSSRYDVVLSAKEDSALERYGALEVEGEKVTHVVEKLPQKMGKGLRVIGIYLLSKNFLQELAKTPLEHYHFEKALASFAQKGKVTYTTITADTITLKYAWDLLSVKDLLLKGMPSYISKNASVSKHAIVSGPVHISEGVRIMEGACIKGPCYLGENVIVGNNAIIRNGVIAEKDVVIGATMEVKNAILLEGTTTHTGFIGDSIIGRYTKIAAGFLTANVRLDRGQIYSVILEETINTHRTHAGSVTGDAANFGVNVTIMPGTIIGNSVTVGPSTVVMENIEDNCLYYTKFETVLKKKNE